jgi:hypothetical protein
LKKIFNSTPALIVVIISLTGCDYRPSSFGDFQKIVLYADSSIYKEVRVPLEQIFDQYIYTPHLEQSFILDLQPLKELGTYQTRHNLIFIGLLNGKDSVSKFMTNVLSEQTKAAVNDGRVFEIFKEDLFATDQVALFLPAMTRISLKKNLSDRGQIIFDQFNQIYTRLLKKSMYAEGEQTNLADYLTEKYGWRMRIQHDYQLVKEEDDGHFVWLRRFNPDRSLFIYRYASEDFNPSDENLYNLRDSLTAIYFEGDSIDLADTYIKTVTFSGQAAKKIVGVWQNRRHLVGGPFRTYVLYDKQQKYIYLIDLTVTAPGKRKKPFLDQLDIMANTFILPNR